MNVKTMRKFESTRMWLVVVAAGALVSAGVFFWSLDEKAWYGYVVGRDQKIHMVNLTTGELEWSSRFLHELGSPLEEYPVFGFRAVEPWESHDILISRIALNREESVLYIGNFTDFGPVTPVPLIAIRLNETLETVFKINRGDWQEYELEDPKDLDIRNLFFNPFENTIYVKHAGGELHDYMILDAVSGDYLGIKDFSLDLSRLQESSPDGRMMAGFHPSNYYKVPRNEELLFSPAGGVLLNMETHEWSGFNRENSPERNFYPPWGSSTDHYVYVRTRGLDQSGRANMGLEVYDRGSMEMIASNYEFAKFGRLRQHYPSQIPGSNNVVLAVGNEVIVFDGLTAEIIHRIQVMDEVEPSFRCCQLSEVVVFDKPVVPSSR